MMYGMLRAWFGDAFSTYELFGRYDFLIRVWAPSAGTRIQEFCEKVVNQVLDGHKPSLKVMMCESAQYLGVHRADYAHSGELPKAQVLLHDAQKHMSKDAQTKLKKSGIFCRTAERCVDGVRIRCFTLIRNETGTSESERETKMLSMKEALENGQISVRRWSPSLFLKAYQPFPGYDNEPSDYLVSFVAPSYNDVVKVPALILDKLRHDRIQTDTLLATKRFFIESDGVFFI